MVFCLSLWPPRSDSCSFNERYIFFSSVYKLDEKVVID